MTRKADFRKVFEQGCKFPSKFIIIYTLPNGLTCSRVGIAISRKVGNAVVRNRIRRRLREALRYRLKNSNIYYDIVIVVKTNAVESEYAELDNVIARVLKGLTHESNANNTD